jgi:hypothetical protein
MWWVDESGTRRSALMEANEIMYLFETLRSKKDEAMEGFDVVNVFSTLMTSLMDSRAYLKIDSLSMSDHDSDSGWLHLFTRSEVKTTSRRVPVRRGDMAQCWEKDDVDSGQEDDDDNGQEECANFYEADLEASQSPAGRAERAAATELLDGSTVLDILSSDLNVLHAPMTPALISSLFPASDSAVAASARRREILWRLRLHPLSQVHCLTLSPISTLRTGSKQSQAVCMLRRRQLMSPADGSRRWVWTIPRTVCAPRRW